MAETKQSLATKNVVEVIGKVIENNLKVEKDYVNGSLTVKYGDMADQVVEVSVYVAAKKGENKDEPNQKYDKMKDLHSTLTTVAQATEENPTSIVRISGREPFTPQIELNEYASSGEVISNPQVSLGFGNIKIVDIKPEDFKATYEMVVFLTANPKMVEDRLKVDAVYINYKGEIKPLSFFVEDEDLIEGIEGCEKGQTIEIWGDVKIANVVETKEKKSGFGGKAKTDTTITTTRELIITGGNPIDDTDKRAINADDVKKGFVEREAFLEELKKDKADNKKKDGGTFAGNGSKSASKKTSDIPF